MSQKIYEQLEKAQNECYAAKEDKLFDSCQYHIDYYFKNDLSKSEELVILKFAKDVYKIATLRKNLDPLV
tara:strand:- start:397 stop:606 length:210 start_codon:yes stop_codon:yes gene_type:complete